ncbi:hypothetical protein ACO3_560013 [Thiomonas arsenitoxydans]|nr:hypothetical protein ACO3_560013 [Thiomonas arsenitoxydans]
MHRAQAPFLQLPHDLATHRHGHYFPLSTSRMASTSSIELAIELSVNGDITTGLPGPSIVVFRRRLHEISKVGCTLCRVDLSML